MAQSYHVTKEQLTAVALRLFKAMGYGDEDAGYAANVLVKANERGVDSHGVARLPMYYDFIKTGKMINMSAKIKIDRDIGSLLLVDADHGLGIVMMPQAMKIAAQRARETGLCAMAVKNSGHYSAAGCYADACAREGLVAIVMSNTGPSMAPLGGKGMRVLGNAPWSIAMPGGKRHPDPVMFDMACSETSWGKCQNYVRAGKPAPDGWGVDAHGAPCHDPLEIQKSGALLPFGGPKGYCICTLVEMLSCILPGAAFGDGAGTSSYHSANPFPENLGQLVVVLDPFRLREREEYEDSIDAFCDMLKAASPEGGEVIVPGEIEARAYRKREAEGMDVEASIAEGLVKTAVDLGLLRQGQGFEDLLN